MCTNPKNVHGFWFHCGKCFECCNAYSNMWAQRCIDESKLYVHNCFVTLTYSKTDGDLHKDDLQKFLKRLRKKIEPHKIRYFGCGEYGGRGNRPHYHLIIFGWQPPDMKFVSQKKGVRYYGSKFLEQIWQGNEKIWQDTRQGGFISVAEVNFRTCRYCAKYLQKLDERPHNVAPFTVMSRRPGIGAQSVKPSMLIDGLMYCDSKALPIPKFYIDKLEQMGYNVDVLKEKRKYLYSAKNGSFTDLSAVESARKRGAEQLKWLKKM